MSHGLPVDLSPRPQPLQACRWCVTYPGGDAGHWREAYFSSQPLADAYVVAHRGAVIVRLAALDPWPERPS